MAKQLPHWFDAVMGVALLKSVKRGGGHVTLELEINESPLKVSIPEGFDECSTLGEALAAIGEILKRPPPLAELESAARDRKQPDLFPRCEVCRKADATGNIHGVPACSACRSEFAKSTSAATAKGPETAPPVSEAAPVGTETVSPAPVAAPLSELFAKTLRRAFDGIPDWVWSELRGTEVVCVSPDAPGRWWGVPAVGNDLDRSAARVLQGPCEACEGFGFTVVHGEGPEGADAITTCKDCSAPAPVDDPHGYLAHEPSRGAGAKSRQKNRKRNATKAAKAARAGKGAT